MLAYSNFNDDEADISMQANITYSDSSSDDDDEPFVDALDQPFQTQPDSANQSVKPTLPSNDDSITNHQNNQKSFNEQPQNLDSFKTNDKPANEELSLDQLEHVEGFHLVQATGLIDTSTPAPSGSHLPTFATPSPSAKQPIPPSAPAQFTSLDVPAPAPAAPMSTPLEDNSKSKQFNQRFDVFLSLTFST